MTQATILFVGGGTGGHVYPMVAVADAIGRLMPSVRRVFVGTTRGLETKVVPALGYELEVMESLPLRGAGLAGAARGAMRAASALPTARSILLRHQPRAVFSLGGYAAGSISLMARVMGIPLALMEPNSVAGLANRLIARWVQRAYVAFPETAASFPSAVTLRTGVAIRQGFDPVPFEGPHDPLRILVLGGSQGAQALNDAVPEALARLGVPFQVVHQSGSGKEDAVKQVYASLGVHTATVTAFISDVAGAIAAADVVLGRSGAGAVSEICSVGRPSILVPYPHAAGDHQRVNALSLVSTGAAILVDNSQATPDRLALELRRLVDNPQGLKDMARSARDWGRPGAAIAVAKDLLTLARLGAAADAASGPRGVLQPLEGAL